MQRNRARLRCKREAKVEDPMKFKVIAAAILVGGIGALLAVPADAQTDQTRKKTVVYNRDRTVMVSRDEDGRTRTRIIIQKRSYLDRSEERRVGKECRSRVAP